MGRSLLGGHGPNFAVHITMTDTYKQTIVWVLLTGGIRVFLTLSSSSLRGMSEKKGFTGVEAPSLRIYYFQPFQSDEKIQKRSGRVCYSIPGSRGDAWPEDRILRASCVKNRD